MLLGWLITKTKQAYKERQWGILVIYATLVVIVGIFIFVFGDRLAGWVNDKLDERSSGDMMVWLSNFLSEDLFLIIVWILLVVTAVVGFVILYRHAGQSIVHRDVRKERKNKVEALALEVIKYEEDKGWKDGKPIGECGLIFTNSSSTILNNCQARLLDIAYEIPHKEYGLHTYPKAEDLNCDKTTPAFSKSKIPLFRWKGTFVDKEFELVYKNIAHKIGYGITNTPILVLLNIWAENMQVHYTICKLEDRLGWGYLLTILKTGLQQDNLNLATFQLSNSRKEDSQFLVDEKRPTVRTKIIKPMDEYANIEVNPTISVNRAELVVENIGADANFTAVAMVAKGILSKTRYTMCWDSPPHLEHPIKKGGASTIGVAEKEPATTQSPSAVPGGLVLLKWGTSEVEKIPVTTEELRQRVMLNARYPSMKQQPVDDSCTLEITITSSPPLLFPSSNQKYIIKIDHEQGGELLFTLLPELNPDKEGSQTE